MGERLSLVERLQKKSKRTEKFSEEQLFKMIESSNLGSSTPLSLEDDGEVSNKPHPVLEYAIRKIGSDCIVYQDSIGRAKMAIQDLTVILTSVGGVIALHAPASPDGISIIFAVSILAAGRDLLYGDFFDVHYNEIKDKKTEIENELLALSLPQEYVTKNFSKIVSQLARREKKSREPRPIPKEIQIEEKRVELGLSNPNESIDPISVEDLLQNQKRNQSSHQ